MAIMPKIYPVNASIDDANDLKEQFARFGRDYYPNEVYQFIFDTLIEQADCLGEHVELDVIAWACDLTYTTLAQSEFDELAELVDYLQEHTTVICEGKNGAAVYHLAY